MVNLGLTFAATYGIFSCGMWTLEGLNMSKEGIYTGGLGVGLDCEWVMLNFLKNIMKIIAGRF